MNKKHQKLIDESLTILRELDLYQAKHAVNCNKRLQQNEIIPSIIINIINMLNGVGRPTPPPFFFGHGSNLLHL
jgi:hypothetical protein